MATFPLFAKGYAPEKKKRKTEAEVNLRKKEYESKDRKREFLSHWLKEFPWLRFDKTIGMTCDICKVFGKEKIGPYVQGSTTYRKESLKSHEQSDGHITNTKREYAKKNPFKTVAAKALQTLNSKTFNQLNLKFRNVHFLCKYGKPFTDYIQMCCLDEAKSLDVGNQYRNDKSAIEFAKFIAEAERDRIRKYIENCNFVSVISDGTTDCSYQEAETVLVRACCKGEINVFFSLVKNVPRGDAETICKVLVSGLEHLCHDFKKKLVGTGTDGASSMLGAKKPEQYRGCESLREGLVL